MQISLSRSLPRLSKCAVSSCSSATSSKRHTSTSSSADASATQKKPVAEEEGKSPQTVSGGLGEGTITPSQAKPSTTPKKTQAELDRDLQASMAGIAGDGGNAGLELEDGKPVSMKRSVRENMFRYI